MTIPEFLQEASTHLQNITNHLPGLALVPSKGGHVLWLEDPGANCSSLIVAVLLKVVDGKRCPDVSILLSTQEEVFDGASLSEARRYGRIFTRLVEAASYLEDLAAVNRPHWEQADYDEVVALV